MSQIDVKYQQLKSTGLDLGPDLHPGAPDESAGYGGTYRQYKNGNIYFHPGVSPQAHEVHGGILSLYLEQGGPGIDRTTGLRLFGFPKTDEVLCSIDRTPCSTFETGAIYWTQGTGGVTLTGAAYRAFAENGLGVIGLPLTSNIKVAGGEAIFASRGVAWGTDAVPNGTLIGLLRPPLLGTPMVLDPTPQPLAASSAATIAAHEAMFGGTPAGNQPTLPNIFHFQQIPRVTYDALMKMQPGLFQSIWSNRLSIINTGSRTHRIPADCIVTATAMTDPTAPVSVTGALRLTTSDTAQDNTLYDLEMSIPKGAGFYPLSPHAIYLKTSWSDFGLLHITDIHLSIRNQNLRAKLIAVGNNDSAAEYANCQDQFRDFIHYANHLHSIGLADAVMATGDLIDYGSDAGDDPYFGNARRLRNMILGQPFDTGVPPGEELLIPIFTTFGNHDHRLNAFDLMFRLDFSGLTDWLGAKKTLDNFSTFNLENGDVEKVQGGVPEYSIDNLEKPKSFLVVGESFPYFDYHFGPRNNKVALGQHRLVILDSGGDAGVPSDVNLIDLPKLLVDYEFNDLSGDTLELMSGCPNSTGYSQLQLEFLRDALVEAGSSGLVIVGVHLPPVAPTHGYNDYLRETEHPTANPNDIPAYLSANKIDSAGWLANGTPYFKTGDVEPSLAYGIGTGGAQDLLNLCAGINAPRPIDALLCGHHHDRVEFRIRYDQARSQLEYYMDFYTENPASYFSSNTWPGNKNFHVIINQNARLNGEQGTVTANVKNGPVTYNTLTVPPYADPLNSSKDAASWWQKHRPLLMQTAALGPIDPRQRYIDRVADPTFQGFRLLVVKQNIIQKIRYVTIQQLRSSNFVLPWEREDVQATVPLATVIPLTLVAH